LIHPLNRSTQRERAILVVDRRRRHFDARRILRCRRRLPTRRPLRLAIDRRRGPVDRAHWSHSGDALHVLPRDALHPAFRHAKTIWHSHVHGVADAQRRRRRIDRQATAPRIVERQPALAAHRPLTAALDLVHHVAEILIQVAHCRHTHPFSDC
jgi:hypothetical protein